MKCTYEIHNSYLELMKGVQTTDNVRVTIISCESPLQLPIIATDKNK